jgi:NAD(P)-dependent dehydrogenase (short-subunit alcohol dehydrogenase family)
LYLGRLFLLLVFPYFNLQETRAPYFVTGATGIVGKRLVKKRLERKGSAAHFPIRQASENKVDGLRAHWGVSAQRAVPEFGDLTADKLDRDWQFIAYAGDIADMQDADRFAKLSLDNHGDGDLLINNAGRSICRAIKGSHDRFHDRKRTMQLNSFGCLRLTMGFLPSTVAKKRGCVVNIGPIGVPTNAPRFSACVASEAALDAWIRCAPVS